jgi:hypothetical protein
MALGNGASAAGSLASPPRGSVRAPSPIVSPGVRGRATASLGATPVTARRQSVQSTGSSGSSSAPPSPPRGVPTVPAGVPALQVRGRTSAKALRYLEEGDTAASAREDLGAAMRQENASARAAGNAVLPVASLTARVGDTSAASGGQHAGGLAALPGGPGSGSADVEPPVDIEKYLVRLRRKERGGSRLSQYSGNAAAGEATARSGVASPAALAALSPAVKAHVAGGMTPDGAAHARASPQRVALLSEHGARSVDRPGVPAALRASLPASSPLPASPAAALAPPSMRVSERRNEKGAPAMPASAPPPWLQDLQMQQAALGSLIAQLRSPPAAQRPPPLPQRPMPVVPAAAAPPAAALALHRGARPCPRHSYYPSRSRTPAATAVAATTPALALASGP